MEEPKQADHSVTAVIVAHTAMVFVLDVLTPVGIAISDWIQTRDKDG